jgi:hypothetical protein
MTSPSEITLQQVIDCREKALQKIVDALDSFEETTGIPVLGLCITLDGSAFEYELFFADPPGESKEAEQTKPEAS